MGWWWKSDPQTPVLHPSDPTPDPLPTASQPPASPREIADGPAHPPSYDDDAMPKPARSRDEQADAELSSFLAELASPGSRQHGTHGRPGADATVPSTATTSISAFTPTTSQPPSPTALPNDDLTTYPRTMSCRAAFDSAFYCQSLGGQFNAIYRHGQLRSCAPLWSDFWFCMRLKSYTEEEKAEMISGRYREKEEAVRRGGIARRFG
ncbi:Early meiotic induction protein 1 [Coniosporium tulheliwenetii]|uniref:Early meiotic induction protein 1 n=1 Tax=Coniosporium tulheliwenetii TaxID=3383036 RepID=A0ACC2YIL7_9PEZI|nr:Early meiotic induction protein 1 [Cladosporium sp. JES 115]